MRQQRNREQHPLHMPIARSFVRSGAVDDHAYIYAQTCACVFALVSSIIKLELGTVIVCVRCVKDN